MATRLQYYSAVAEQAAKDVIAGRGNWQNFLDTASRLYKYPFPDQLMIYAQRPDAIACATLETWNGSFKRWVRRGSRGIALIDDSGDRPRIKYVFDVTDTEPSQYRSRPVQLWEMRQEHRGLVLDYLADVYDDIGGTLADSFHNIAMQLAREYYEDNAREIRYRAEDSFLEDFDDLNLSVAFEKALANSVAYALMSRCGLDTAEYFDDDDFQYIFEFNTPDMVYALGTAAAELTQQVLRDVELVIKKHERSVNKNLSVDSHERSATNERITDILPERGLPVARPDAGRAAEGTDGAIGQVREDEESVLEGTPHNIIQLDAAQRNAVPAPARDGGSGEREDGAGDESPDVEEQPPGQGGRPVGLDGGDERAEGASRGNGTERTDLHVEENPEHHDETPETPPAQVTPEPGGVVKPTETGQQIGGGSISEALSTSSIMLDEVDSILRDGGNDKNSALRIASFFSKNMTPEANAGFLKREYLLGRWGRSFTPGGKGYQFGAQQTSIWFDENGIRIGRGKSALFTTDFSLITWEQAAARVRELYDAGQYVSHDVLDEAIDNEHRELAERLLHLYRDDFRDFRDMPQEWEAEKGGWPADVERVTELLKDKGDSSEYSIILENLEGDVAALETDPKAPARFMHDPYRILQDVRNAGLQANGFPAADNEQHNYMRFITDDEVDRFLIGDGSYSERKLRILSFFLNDHTPKERQDFLKHHYGHGGGSWVGGGWEEAEPGKGITLKRPDCDNVNLNWNQAARKFDSLINSGHYISRDDLGRIFNYERLTLARELNHFYYNMPDEYQCPFAKELDFNYPKDDEWAAINGLLDNSDHIDALFSEMKYLFDNTPEDDRYFDARKQAFEHFSAFRDGTYTLFPGLEDLPDPDIVEARVQRLLPAIPQPTAGHTEQLSLFDFEPPPILPGVEEQQATIEYKENQEAGANAPVISSPITQDEIDALLLTISDDDKARIVERFAVNPRSREAVQLVRDIYGRIEETIKPLEGSEGYLGILGESAGVAIVRGAAAVTPMSERPPAETLALAWPAVHKRIAELVVAGKLAVTEKSEQPVVEDETPEIPEGLEEQQAPEQQQVPEQQQSPGNRVELDFNTAAETALARVMADSDYSDALMSASSRASLRNPCTWALEQSIRDHQQDEPEVFRRYFTDEDFNDDLFNYVLRQSWANRPTLETVITEQPITVEASNDDPAPQTTDQDLPHYKLGDTFYMDGGKLYTIRWIGFHEVGYYSPETPFISKLMEKAEFENLLRDDPANSHLLISDEQQSDLVRQELESRGFVASEELIESGVMEFNAHGRRGSIEDIADFIEDEFLSEEEPVSDLEHEGIENPDAPATPVSVSPERPDPVFFLDWETAKYDFDLDLYNDRDVIGYNKDGVRYNVGRSGNLTYVTTTTGITPWGDILGDTDIPQDIWRLMNDYRDGKLTDEQVREGYLEALESFRASQVTEPQSEPQFTEITDPAVIAEVEAVFGENDEPVERYSPQPFAQRLYSIVSSDDNSTTSYYLIHCPDEIDAGAVLDHDTLALVKSSADRYVICAEACYLSAEEMAQWNIEFRKMPRDWGLLPEPIQSQIRPIMPEYEKQWQEQSSLPIFPSFEEQVRSKLFERGFEVTYDLIEDGLYKFFALGGLDDAGDAAAFIENEYFTEESDWELEEVKTQAAPVTEKSIISVGENFRITDDHLGEGGAKTKFLNNLNAINALKSIEREQRAATLDEQYVLSRYIGWGGLPQAFDHDNMLWANEHEKLTAVLTPDEYESARASTLNAHYTSPTVIRSIYETVERLGFKSGNILEPSCGIGNFFGLLPNSMNGSKLYGVELDSITARIAKLLYPKADVRETGFEKTDMPDAFFDLAIGNVPFGGYTVADRRYDKQHLQIHDYFFAKTLDQVRPGGIIAFVTSKGTLDKQNPEVRKYIAQRAELLGAVRLPNNAFLKNAGTEVTSDIIFLQKRDRPIDVEPDWIHLGYTGDGVPVNRYFADNPEMLLGKMSFDDRMYGDKKDTTCNPIEGADLAEQLNAALLNIQGQYTVEELDDLEGVDNHAIPADPNVRNFSYALIAPAAEPGDVNGELFVRIVSGGSVYFRENSLMYPVDLPATTIERIKGMIALRDCVQGLINLQLDEYIGDEAISAKQAELSELYDSFTADYGLINSQANNRAFNADSAYYLLSSLEILDEDGELERKADMFTRRTIKQKVAISHVDTASEALAVSLGERACVDMEFMSQLTGKNEGELFSDLRGVIFLDLHFNGNIDSYTYRTADDFLSGNVRERLKKYTDAIAVLPEDYKHYEAFADNVRALEAAMPKELDASEIAVRLGSTWIDPDYVQQFMHSLLKTSWRMQNVYQVKYHQYTGEWQVSGKGRSAYNDVLANVTYGTDRMNAYQIIDDTLNLRDVRVYDYKTDADGKEKRVLNKKATTLAQQKQELIKQAFKDWIWQDPERRQELVTLYNERFNSVRPREFDGSHITFSGISPEITLRPHQLNAIAHILYGGNTLLAHEVGAGKTFEMVGAAMEGKRLGLCHKSLFAVPNHLTEQWAGEFLRLYPSANILVATKKDFEMRNRKKFCAKIATGDYDAVIIGHSQLEKIPMSKERQERLLNEQIWEIEEGIRELKDSNGERWSIKQLEKTKKSLEARLSKLLDAKKRDDVVTYEQLGVDRLFVDEAHGFKNLFLYTKMRNVAGLSTSEAQKSSDLFMKCRYMDELTGNRGVIFATGTPISNSMTEMYTMQRYLQYDSLIAKRLVHFDAWASTFGETQTSIELAPEGTGYRARTRFAKFHNLPELMCMFKEVADIQTADMLNLPVPEAKFENIIVEPSELQQEMVQELSVRAAKVHSQSVDARVDNMLKITTDGRKIGLDQRLMNPMLPDFEGSKVNACTDNVYRIWDETKDGRLTQLVFCDFSTPNKDGRFNVYDDIKAKLIERGIPEDEIAFIHDADTETRKKELFAKVRQGKVRVLFGSTFKMGSGTNVQDRLIAIHDADCPWRPADLEQRAGRIVRQGNKNAEVQIFRYATSGTFDSYLWQTVESKQKFIAQIMTSKSPARSCDDVDETALSYAEIKALCAGNPLIAEKMNLDVEVAKLRMLKSEYLSQHFRLEDDLLKRYPQQITAAKERIAGIEKDLVMYNALNEKLTTIQTSLSGAAATATAKFAGMTINGVEYKEKEPAAKALLEAFSTVKGANDTPIGNYMGFDMSLHFDTFTKTFSANLRGSMTYQVVLGEDAFGNITRINNTLADLPKKLSGAKTQLETLYQQQEAAKQELEKPFALVSELAEKEARLALLNADLNIDGDGGFDVMNDTEDRETEEFLNRIGDALDEMGVSYTRGADAIDAYEPRAVSAKSAKPSLLEGLRTFNPERSETAISRKPPGIGI